MNARELLEELAALKKALKVADAKNAGSLANNLCPDHRDKQVGKPCLACSLERAESIIESLAAQLVEAQTTLGFAETELLERQREIAERDAAFDKMVAAKDEEIKALKLSVDSAIKDTWEMVDPLRPPPAGSYNAGHHNGVCDALKTLRDNLTRHAYTKEPT